MPRRHFWSCLAAAQFLGPTLPDRSTDAILCLSGKTKPADNTSNGSRRANPAFFQVPRILLSCITAVNEGPRIILMKPKLKVAMSAKIKVAILQRVLPEFRYRLFRELSNDPQVEIKVFYSRGDSVGSTKERDGPIPPFGVRLASIVCNRKHWRVIQPTLLIHLMKYNPLLIVTEPTPYFPNNLAAFVFAKLLGKRFVWWEVGSTRKRGLLRRIIEPFLRVMIRKADSYIAYSSMAKSYLHEEYGIDQSKIFVAQNTIYNCPAFDKRVHDEIKNELNIGNDDLVLSYIGALEKRKRLELLIDSFRVLSSRRPVHLLIIGDGRDEQFYRRYLGHPQEGVHFLGHKSIEEANDYLAVSHYTLLPSQGGLAINHSLSCGTPVICGVNDGTERDLIKDGFNGYVVKGLDSPTLVSVLSQEYQFDRLKIIEHYTEHFSHVRMIAEIKHAITSSARS